MEHVRQLQFESISGLTSHSLATRMIIMSIVMRARVRRDRFLVCKVHRAAGVRIRLKLIGFKRLLN